MAAPFTLTLNATSLLELPSTANSTTPYVLPSSISMSQTGDGGGTEFSFDIIQDVTPSGTTPWYVSIPDNAKVEFKDSALSATSGGQVLFRGYVTNVSAKLNGSATGTTATVSCADSSTLLDRRVVYKPQTSTIAGRAYYSIKLGSQTDKSMIEKLLDYVNAYADATVKALWDTSIKTGITSTCTLPAMTFQVGSFRAAMDAILSEAQSQGSGIQRRFYVDNTTQAGGGGRLVYGLAPAASGSFATAPLEIRTTIENPDPTVATGTGRTASGGSSTAASTYNARSLTLEDDHDSTRKIVYLVAADLAGGDTDADPYRRTYTQTGIAFPARSGALLQEEMLDAPMIGGVNRTTKLTNISKAYFASFYKPLRTIRFKVTGKGTKDWNAYGFAAGWRQSAAATYAFVDRWECGQYVRVVAPELGLTYDAANPELSLYRVEKVTMAFEGTSYVRTFDITLERRPRGNLSRYLAGKR